MDFDVARHPLPTTLSGGYLSSLIALPGAASVLLSLPSKGATCRLCRVDLVGGRTVTGKGLPGDLRAVVLDDDSAVAGWALATYGLCRISLDPLARTGEVVRAGIGKHQSHLFALSTDLLGVSQFHGASVSLVSRATGAVVTRLRTGAPALVHDLVDGTKRCWSPHRAGCADLDVDRRGVTARHEIPYGRGPALVGDRMLVVCGERVDNPHAPGVWHTTADELVAFDAHTLAIVARGAAPRTAIEVLGADAAGRIVVSTARGFGLHDPTSLTVVAVHEEPGEIGGAVLLPGTNAVVLQGQIASDGLTVVRWS